jgi:imidazole glycerol-phosphate synthase subunit HisH
VVLPGVGAFGDAMSNLRTLALVEPIRELIAADRPLIGICLGLQLLFESSNEMGEHRGLGVLPGRARCRFPERADRAPHGLEPDPPGAAHPALAGAARPRLCLFRALLLCASPRTRSSPPPPTMGSIYASVVARGNLYGIQFHPEKSQAVGERILRNWLIACGILPHDAAWEAA